MICLTLFRTSQREISYAATNSKILRHVSKDSGRKNKVLKLEAQRASGDPLMHIQEGSQSVKRYGHPCYNFIFPLKWCKGMKTMVLEDPLEFSVEIEYKNT